MISAPFVPPCPYRPQHPYALLPWVRIARDNSAAVWPVGAFWASFMARGLPGRKLFVLNNATAVRQVLLTNAANYQKSRDTRRVLRPLIGDGLFISEGPLWRRQRRLLMPALHARRLPDFLPVMGQVGLEMLERWERLGAGAEVDMGREMTRVTAEVVSRVLLSFPLGQGRTDAVYTAFNDYQDSLGRLDVLGLLGAPDWLPRPGEGRARQAVAVVDALIDEILQARAPGRQPGRGDLLDLLLGARDEAGLALAPCLVRDEIKVLFLAGHETTATTLVWALFLLASSPAVQEQVKVEADRTLGAEVPGPQELERLVFTRAVVQESLRLYPPIHQFAREALGEDRIGEHLIPPGSLMLVAPWLLHRHHRYWSEPDAFRPERFLRTPERRRPNHAYLPFSTGPRLCPGAAFGMAETTLILALAVQRFRLFLRPGHPVEPLGRLTLRPRLGMPLRLERR